MVDATDGFLDAQQPAGSPGLGIRSHRQQCRGENEEGTVEHSAAHGVSRLLRLISGPSGWAELSPPARTLCEWLAARQWDFRTASEERGITPASLYREWLEALGWNQSLAARIYRRPGTDERAGWGWHGWRGELMPSCAPRLLLR